MEDVFDVIIIGGGIYGSACSFFLKNEQNRVLLIEKDKIGSKGATGYSRGITRVYDPDKDLMELSLQSVKDFLNWEKFQLPGPNPYTKSGFLYLLNKSEIQKAKEFQDSIDQDAYPIEILYPQDLEKRFKWVKNPENKIGIYEKNGGYGDPALTAVNFANGFRNKGGEVYENCSAHRINQIDDAMWEVELSEEKLKTKVLLLATGAYTKQILPELPIFTRSISLTQMKSSKSIINISIIDEEIETYIRPGDGPSFYCGSQIFEKVDHPNQLKPSNGKDVEDSIRRLDGLLQLPLKEKPINRIKGFDSYTDQKKPIVQFLKDYKGLYVATGFSGKGYKCCLSISKSIANQIHQYLRDDLIENDIMWRYDINTVSIK